MPARSLTATRPTRPAVATATGPIAGAGADAPAGPEWIVCPGCRELVYGKRLARNLQVCPGCDHHHRLTAPDRLDQLLDAAPRELLDLQVHSVDVLGFTDTLPYPERLDRARAATGLDEGVVVARGAIEGHRLVVAVFDFRFLGGSLGAAAGELVTQAAELALAEHVPLLLVPASGGARMQEGVLSLMQMAKTSQALARLDEAGILTISLITDPTYGGVAASFATLADVVVAEPGARLGFAGPRVIEQTIRATLPPGFQTAQLLLEQGLLDMVVPRRLQRAALARLLAASGTSAVRRSEAAGGGTSARRPRPHRTRTAGTAGTVIRDPDQLPEADPWKTVQTVRAVERPSTLDYVDRIFDDFVEMHGDRLGGDCPAVVGGIARFGARSVMVIGHERGRTVADLASRNYGMPMPSGYRKAVRLMRTAAKLGLPVVSFVDTPGAYPGLEAEERGQAMAVAESLRVMARLPVPVVTVVTGQGGSGGALALAVADEVLICANGVYSVISPEGCAAILWNDPARAPDAAAALGLDAREVLRLGIVDGVILEPEGGAQADPAQAARLVGRSVDEALDRLGPLDPTALVARRWARFRAHGTASVTA
jgi:acetyl-CoA carboxylase carboxyl transferase subunit beta